MPNYAVTDISNIAERHPVRAFEACWRRQAEASGTPVPLRSQINPAEIAGVLPWLLVLEVLRHGDTTDYRYRLAGTACTEMFGVDYTGRMLGEHLTPEGEEIRRREFAQLLGDSQPIISTTNLPIRAKDFIRVHRGVFPLRTSGPLTDQIFVVIAPVATECATRIISAV